MGRKWAGGDFSAYIPHTISKFSIHKCVKLLNNVDTLYFSKFIIFAQIWAGMCRECTQTNVMSPESILHKTNVIYPESICLGVSRLFFIQGPVAGRRECMPTNVISQESIHMQGVHAYKWNTVAYNRAAINFHFSI